MDYNEFREKLQKDLMKKLKLKNIHQVPAINKVVVSIGIGSLHTRKGVKDFSEIERNLMTIT